MNSMNSWNVSGDFGNLLIFYAIKYGYAAVRTVLMFLIPRQVIRDENQNLILYKFTHSN